METNTNTPEAKQPASAGCHPTTCSASVDTTEMDAAWSAHCIDPESASGDPWELAKKLETERNAALRTLREMSRRAYQDAGSRAVAWNKLRDERDESRREAEDFRDNMRIHLTEGDGRFSWENKELSNL